MKIQPSIMYLPMAVFALTLVTACDKTTASKDWVTETINSPVQGDQFIAKIQINLDTYRSAFRQITITCTERTKDLEIEFGIYGESKNDPTFIFTLTENQAEPYLKGYGIVAGNTNRINANDIVKLGGFKNVATLRQTNESTHMAHSVAAQLPLAVELESNFGTITYEIPKSTAIMNVVSKCIPTSDAPTVITSEHVTSETLDQPLSTSITSLSDSEIGKAIVGKSYNIAQIELRKLGLKATRPINTGLFSMSVAGDPSECTNDICSIPWVSNDFATCVNVKVDDNLEQKNWIVTSAGECE